MTLSNLQHCSGTNLMTVGGIKLFKKGWRSEPTDSHGYFGLPGFEVFPEFSLQNNSSYKSRQPALQSTVRDVVNTTALLCLKWKDTSAVLASGFNEKGIIFKNGSKSATYRGQIMKMLSVPYHYAHTTHQRAYKLLKILNLLSSSLQ